MVGLTAALATFDSASAPVTAFKWTESVVYTCNAGSIPRDHWSQDPIVGGGRLLGEACHFVRLASVS